MKPNLVKNAHGISVCSLRCTWKPLSTFQFSARSSSDHISQHARLFIFLNVYVISDLILKEEVENLLNNRSIQRPEADNNVGGGVWVRREPPM